MTGATQAPARTDDVLTPDLAHARADLRGRTMPRAQRARQLRGA
jgi:hypothetical protein